MHCILRLTSRKEDCFHFAPQEALQYQYRECNEEADEIPREKDRQGEI